MSELIKNIEFVENTFIYIDKPFTSIDFSKLNINIIENNNFQVFYSFSLNLFNNYTEYKTKNAFSNIINLNQPLYISIYFKKFVFHDLKTPTTLQNSINVNASAQNLIFDKILYDNVEIEKSLFKIRTEYSIINELPKWNFNDNQENNIRRWLSQCNSVAEMFGVTAIYFKTEPIENEIVHTFGTYVIRNVVNIKKIHIMFPDNELPQDRSVILDWDYPLQDEFIIHIVKEKFEQAFGYKTPSEKDYLFIPMLNKMFKVNSLQPKNGFMGKIGWWETYLGKYEDDETVVIDDELKYNLNDISEFDASINFFQENLRISDSEYNNLIEELNDFRDSTVLTQEKIDVKTIEEQKKANQNFTNKLEDSNFYVSLKETESQREFYHNRLNIISVNPENNSFPITMYDLSSIEKRIIALTYNLNEYTVKNKFNLTSNKNLSIIFNFVLLNNFTGEIIDFIDSQNNIVLTITFERNNLKIIDNFNQVNFKINYDFLYKELYQIEFFYDQKNINIKIFMLKNREKIFEFQDTYINDTVTDNANIVLNKINLFGGKYLINDILFKINDNLILSDYCNPILKMNKFL